MPDRSRTLPYVLSLRHVLLMHVLTYPKVEEVGKARPEITKATETMIKKGKWTVPGYRVSLALLLLVTRMMADSLCRRSSESSLFCRWMGRPCNNTESHIPWWKKRANCRC